MFRAHGPRGAVAIKMLGPASDLDDAAQARFRREIGALQQLAHPRLVRLLDHGVDPELGLYLVLPLLAGVNLRTLCAGRALCPEAALLLLHPIAEATAALHAAGYVHRDLKPENAIADPDGGVTVIDLGLAWRHGMTRHTETGAVVGSVGYMSPEQLEARPVDARADVWALGVMLYEWIVGSRPFARGRPAEEGAAMLLGRFPRLTSADRRASDELANLVARCLDVEPARRPSAVQLVRELGDMIDWTDAIAVERAAVIADPVGYQARVAPLRAQRLERRARDAIESGQPFVALGWCDRGLAYVPDHAGLLALVASAELATARVPPPIDASASPGDAAPPAASAFAAPSTPPGRSPFARWALPAAALAVAVGVVIGVVAIASRERHPSAVSTVAPAPSTPPADRDRELMHDTLALFAHALAAPPSSGPSSPPSDQGFAIMHDTLSLFARALAARDGASRPAPETDPDTTEQPTTATGWLTHARTQSPAAAVASIRQALALAPEWSDAQAALCLALAAAHDDGALPACEIAIARRPHDVAMIVARSSARMHAGQLAAALADANRAVAADPDPKWRRWRAQVRTAVGDAAGATRDRASACQLGDAVACEPPAATP